MIDAATFRQVLGSYPTGVCAITTLDADNVPHAMVVGSFSSVSLDPPLVGFFPDKKSLSWPRMERTGRFCVNILGSDQRALCRQLTVSGGEKFSGVGYSLSGNGAPLLDGVIGWIDCDLHSVTDAGDHFLVLGKVLALGNARDGDPMLFFKGRYGGYADAV
jgi:3-hydroxy-9,10-secoandrosta-1,3,5(10)-triene-9,17-dione monooxygenase reductase component